VEGADLGFVVETVQREDFLLVLQQDDLGGERGTNDEVTQSAGSTSSSELVTRVGVTWPMHTTSDSPPGAVDTLLGWKSIFTTWEELKTSREDYLEDADMERRSAATGTPKT